MAFDYQTALDRTANVFALNDARRLALASQDVQRSEQLLDTEAQRAFTRELQADIGKRSINLVREQEKLREQGEIAREKRAEKTAERRERDIIEAQLTALGATFSGDTSTDDLRRFLAAINSQLTGTRTKNLESSFQGLANQRNVLQADIDRLARELSSSAISEQKQRAIALRLSADKKLDLTNDQRNRLQLFGTGQGAQRSARGASIQPLSPNDLLILLPQSDRNEVAARIAEELTATADPKRDVEVLGIASQIQSRQNELKRLDTDRDILLKADPTLLRFESMAPQGPPQAFNAPRGNVGAASSFVGNLPPPPPISPQATFTPAAAVAAPVQPSPFIPAAPGLVQQGLGLVRTGAEAVAPFAASPAMAAGAAVGPAVGNLYQQNVAPMVDVGRTFVGPPVEQFMMRMFGVDNPNATPEEGAAVERLARLQRGYSDAEIERKRALAKAGDIATLQELFGYLNQVRNMNRARGIQTPVLQTPVGSSTNVFAPAGP